MFEEQIEILQRHLLVFFAVDDQHRRAGFFEPALAKQRERRHYGAKLVESFLAEEIGSGFDEIKKIGVGVARARLPLRLKKIVDATAPIDCATQFVRRGVSELCRPMAAKAGAYHGDFVAI